MRKFLQFPHWPSGGLPHALVIACGVALLVVGLPMAMALGSGSPARPALSVPSSAQQGEVRLVLADTATATLTDTDTDTATPTATLTATSVVSGTGTATVTATVAAAGTVTETKVTVCHRTGSASNPYVLITVSQNALNAHSAHGDIIPAPPGGCPAALTPSSSATASTTPLATGTSVAQKVTICHRTGSQNHPYVLITVSQDAVPAHTAHGDIVPAPAGGCPAANSPAKPHQNNNGNPGQGNSPGNNPGKAQGKGHGNASEKDAGPGKGSDEGSDTDTDKGGHGPKKP